MKRRKPKQKEHPQTGSKKSVTVLPPAVARPERLPLGDANITWDQFEAFSLDFVSKLDGVVDSKHYGTRGSKQKGIDLYADHANADRWTFQCKQQRKFTVTDARAALKKTTYRAPKGKRVKKKIILVSCEVDSTVRDVIDKQPNWELWDLRDVSKKVRGLELAKARALVEQHFGADWRKIFLGLGPLSPFLTPDQFFSQFLKRDRLFNHAWELVGRMEVLAELEAWTAAPALRLGILPGRGGIGKTKVLQAFSEMLAGEYPKTLVWFVQEGVPLTPVAFDELPLQPTIIVVDDAHRRDDLKLLFAHAARAGDRVKVLLAARVHGIDGLRSAISRAGYDVSETTVLPELKKLGREDVCALASQALGPELMHLAGRLARATKDCPLVTVVGGKLLSQRAVAPELLERNDEFQRAVLERFRDELLGNVCADDPTACHELLKLISATAPVSAEDEPFFSRAAQFLKKPSEWIIGKLGELEKGGLLIRRGRLLRITPDVLSDHLLARACLSVSGASTGYADKIFTMFSEWKADRVLRNLAELDWRVVRAGGKNADLLGGVWRTLETDFARGDWSRRYRVIKVIKEAAYFQPEPALRIARAAIKICAVKRKKRSTCIPGPKDILHVIPEVLQHIAFTIDFLPDCCELLWLLGRGDNRALNPLPSHPVRVLQYLASYKTNKPPQFNQMILECAIRWLGDPKLHEYAHSPFCVIDKLLEKKGESTWSEGAKVVFSPFLISADITKPIREQAIAALSKAAHTARPEIALQALESMRQVLHDDVGMAQPTPEYLQGWLPEKLHVIEEFRRVAEKRDEPIVLWKIQQALLWPSEDSPWPEVRSIAAKVVAGLPNTCELRFLRAMMSEPLVPRRHGSPRTDPDWDKRISEDEAERANFCTQVAEECESRLRKPGRILHAFEQGLNELERAGCSIWPQHLISAIVSTNPNLGIGLAKALIRSPGSRVAQYFHTITLTLAQRLPDAVTPLLEAAGKTKSPRLRFSLAHHFLSSRFERLPGKRELVVLRKLIAHRDANAGRLAIDSLKLLGRHQPDAALKLLLESNFETDSAKAEEACGCLHKEFGIDPATLSDSQLRQIVVRLGSVPNVEGHWIQEFLSYSTTRVPLSVVDLFIRRIAHRANLQNPDYQPIPFNMHVRFDEVVKHPDAIKTLRRVRNLVLRKRWQFPHFAKELFWSLGDIHRLAVLREWLDSNEPSKIVAAGKLLEGAGPNFVFRNPEFVALALRSAHRCGEECYRPMLAYLGGSATTGGRSGTLGQPTPRDVEMRDRATELIARFSGNPIVRTLYDALRKHAEANIERERHEYEEQFGGD